MVLGVYTEVRRLTDKTKIINETHYHYYHYCVWIIESQFATPKSAVHIAKLAINYLHISQIFNFLSIRSCILWELILAKFQELAYF